MSRTVYTNAYEPEHHKQLKEADNHHPIERTVCYWLTIAESLEQRRARHIREPDRSHQEANGGVLGMSPARLGFPNRLKNLVQRRLAKERVLELCGLKIRRP